ncbi:MAG: hypothetical protein HZC44_09520 [Geobacter sp.]|nr:hypothetical protein [Geobacter sp.]
MTMLRHLLALFILLLFAIPVRAHSPYQSDTEIVTDSQKAFEEILDLWRAGKYDELYERTRGNGKVAKEDFARRLERATLKPACCWQKVQNLSVHVESDDLASIRATVGLEGGPEIEFKTRTFKLYREKGRWCIGQTDILSLAGTSKKKSRRK